MKTLVASVHLPGPAQNGVDGCHGRWAAEQLRLKSALRRVNRELVALERAAKDQT